LKGASIAAFKTTPRYNGAISASGLRVTRACFM